jgi:hypothetical protein
MAEPVSPLPPSPQSTVPIPWPQETDFPTDRLQPIPAESFEGFLQRGREAVERSWKQAQSVVSQAFSRAGSRVRHVKRERPLHVMAGVAVAAFMLGAAIRIWRSRHE